ncbi:MAG: UDP-N-acetylglucosamine 2-epimerase [Hyphomicrobiales bacterium]
MNAPLRKIAFVSTARSDYNTMFPVMRRASGDPQIEAQIIAAGMHTVSEFGETWREFEKDGLTISKKVDYLNSSDVPGEFSKELGRGVEEFTEAFLDLKPDIVCVSGDRIENLSLFVAATALGLPIAHMCGGDLTEGAIDNQIRHVMTKLSHLHFVSMPEHARRVIQLGEEPWRVVLTGDAAIDIIVERKPMPRNHIEAELGLASGEPFFLSTYHPQTLGESKAVDQYRNLLAALADIPERPVMIYPNIDPGFQQLVSMLEHFKDRRPDVILRKSFERDLFYGLMSHAEFMIGNSSSGLWEAPSFALPSINIGERQAGRGRGDNVIDVTGLELTSITQAIQKARDPSFRKSLAGMKNPYGEGKAAAITIETLKSVPLDAALLYKKFFEIEFDPLLLGMKGNF